MRHFIPALAFFCLLPSAAHAHGLSIPGEVVFGFFGSILFSIIDAIMTSKNKWDAAVSLIAGLAASAACWWGVATLIGQMPEPAGSFNARVVKEGTKEIVACLLPLACCAVAACAAAHTNYLIRNERANTPGMRILDIACAVLLILVLMSPVLKVTLFTYGVTIPDMLRSIYTMLLMGLVPIVTLAWFAVKKRVTPDSHYNTVVVYAPLFAFLCMMVSAYQVWGILQGVFWYYILFGYPISLYVYMRRRKKAMKGV